MRANLDAKKLIVKEIKEKLTKAKSVTFVDFKGITVGEDYEMRKKLNENGGDYKVYKNRLIVRALAELEIPDCEHFLENNTAIAFSNSDEVSIPKILLDIVEKTKKLKIKFGILSGKAIDSTSVKSLAKLPSKEVLIAMLLGVLQEPTRRVLRVLNAPMQGFVTALDAISKK